MISKLAVSRSRELNPYWKDGGTGLPTKEAGLYLELLLSISDSLYELKNFLLLLQT